MGVCNCRQNGGKLYPTEAGPQRAAELFLYKSPWNGLSKSYGKDIFSCTHVRFGTILFKVKVWKRVGCASKTMDGELKTRYSVYMLWTR